MKSNLRLQAKVYPLAAPDPSGALDKIALFNPDGTPFTASGSGGADGEDGASAYDIAVANGFVGTEVEWLDSLVGPSGADGDDGASGSNGADGSDGLSAYQVAVANGFVGTEVEWLDSLIGAQGPQGDPGVDGVDGADGAPAPGGVIANELLDEPITALAVVGGITALPNVTTSFLYSGRPVDIVLKMPWVRKSSTNLAQIGIDIVGGPLAGKLFVKEPFLVRNAAEYTKVVVSTGPTQATADNTPLVSGTNYALRATIDGIGAASGNFDAVWAANTQYVGRFYVVEY